MKKSWMFFMFLFVLLCLGGSALAGDVELIGAGATFPYPLYSKMFDTYFQEHGIKVNYQSIGSGGGIRQLTNKTVDFGGSDAIMSDKDLKEAGAPVLHIPICAGAGGCYLQIGRGSRIKIHPGRHCGHLSRENQEME